METQQMKLFRAHSAIKLEFRDNLWEGVPVSWYVDREDPPFPYDQLIQIDDHDESDPIRNYPRYYVNGLFTEEEAGALVAYLEAGGVSVNLIQVELPISGIEVGNWMMAYSPTREGHIPLSENVVYNLPFKVNGFFQLEHSQTWREMKPFEPEGERLCAPPMFSQFAQRLCETIGSEDLDVSRVDKALRELETEGWTILEPNDDGIPF